MGRKQDSQDFARNSLTGASDSTLFVPRLGSPTRPAPARFVSDPTPQTVKKHEILFDSDSYEDRVNSERRSLPLGTGYLLPTALQRSRLPIGHRVTCRSPDITSSYVSAAVT